MCRGDELVKEDFVLVAYCVEVMSQSRKICSCCLLCQCDEPVKEDLFLLLIVSR